MKAICRLLSGDHATQRLILISGPTGSGKSTTLYATLGILNRQDNNILTIEDPVEYTLPGINQMQLKEEIGLTFGSALRTFLRQDPDIIMLGEIRDQDTAQMAIRSSLTGHLLLSTLHTNSAWGKHYPLDRHGGGTPLPDIGDPDCLCGTETDPVVVSPHCKKALHPDASFTSGFALDPNAGYHEKKRMRKMLLYRLPGTKSHL